MMGNQSNEPCRLTDFLPTTRKEVELRGWDEVDVVLLSGDAYVDHPSFACAVVGRLLEAEGLRVAVVPQPNWQDDLRDFRKMGRPRLFFAVSAGNMDSMVNHYTANKRLRSDDAYSPDGRPHMRPDRATVTYCRILKRLWPDVPVVIGGIEASLRRFTHYDYWADALMPSILVDSGADLLVYGMGEMPLRALVARLRAGQPWSRLTDIPQTAYLADRAPAAGLFGHDVGQHGGVGVVQMAHGLVGQQEVEGLHQGSDGCHALLLTKAHPAHRHVALVGYAQALEPRIYLLRLFQPGQTVFQRHVFAGRELREEAQLLIDARQFVFSDFGPRGNAQRAHVASAETDAPLIVVAVAQEEAAQRRLPGARSRLDEDVRSLFERHDPSPHVAFEPGSTGKDAWHDAVERDGIHCLYI